MLLPEDIQKMIDDEIDALNWNVPPVNLYEPISYILSLGGKRIRPMLTLMACRMFSGTVQKAIPVALGLEVFHNFTLLHDDVMDKADVRRGKPTVHCKWDENTAILSGDVMQIKAYQLVSGVEEQYLKFTLNLFSKMACEVCEGQQYDMDFEKRMDVSTDEYLDMIRLKTAVLIGTAVQIGSLLGGASQNDAEMMYQYGIHLGLAFQLKDDLLDVYGDEKTFGKRIGGDILCNKKTYLLITALQEAEGELKQKLTDWISKRDFDENEKIRAVTDIYNQLGVKRICEKKMEEYFNNSLNCLQKVTVSLENKQYFINLAKSLMKREL